MNRAIIALTAAAFYSIGAVGAHAYPMIATFDGFVGEDTKDLFTASFHYNPKDLGLQDQDGYRAAVGGLQSATYSDSSGLSFTYKVATSFVLGNLLASSYDPDGTLETSNVVDYSLDTGNGAIDLTFGGFSDGGVATFSSDGLDYRVLTPTKFTLVKDTVDVTTPVSPVPLPAPVLLFGGGLLLLGCLGGILRVSTAKAA